MSITDYAYCTLEQTEVDKIKSLEHELNQSTDDDEIIVLAFRKKK